MSTRIILALTILAAGAAACSDSKKENTPTTISPGTSVITHTSTSVSTGVDTGPATSTGTGVATNPATSVPTVTSTAVATSPGTSLTTGTGVSTGTGTGANTGTGTGTGTADAKTVHSNIINGAADPRVAPVEVAGAAPLTYDPDTKACK